MMLLFLFPNKEVQPPARPVPPVSHLTSYSPTGPNLCFASSVATVFSDPDTLYQPHIPSNKPQIHFPSLYTYTKNLSETGSTCIARSERDDYCAETSFRLKVKRSSPFESAGVSAHPAARRQGGSIWQAMTCLSLSNSWVTHSIPLFTLSSPFLAHLCVITFRMSYNIKTPSWRTTL
jgi:hypothetical protein